MLKRDKNADEHGMGMDIKAYTRVQEALRESLAQVPDGEFVWAGVG